MAGMLAARVLSDYFESVTIIERDFFPEKAEPRRGVPQARHVHVLLKRGQLIMEQLLPGLEAELLNAGAEYVDVSADLAWRLPSGWSPRFRSEIFALCCTRSLIDWAIRQRVAQIPNVKIINGGSVTGLLHDAQKCEVFGVAVRFYSQHEDKFVGEGKIECDFVVDASGRGSRAAQWLREIGYEPPKETVVNAHQGYASRLYKPSANFKADWKGIYLQAAPPDMTRTGLIAPIEGNRWMVTIGGGGGDYPPTDEAGFLEFARSLNCSEFYEAICQAEPLTPIYGARSTENRLRHYEHLSRLPERFIVIGDGVCAFNPVYGQGMSVAAIEAKLLQECLNNINGFKGFTKSFQTKLAKLTHAPWMLATSEDFRYRGTEGKPSLMTKFMHGYMNHVLRIATQNIPVRKLLIEVQQMLKQPTAMFRPDVVARVMWQAFQQLITIEKRSIKVEPRKSVTETI
jgi:2-polyprenyl-6-methoxyphenol hydroxylase-like FAD-dependent oxidoreductase